MLLSDDKSFSETANQCYLTHPHVCTELMYVQNIVYVKQMKIVESNQCYLK